MSSSTSTRVETTKCSSNANRASRARAPPKEKTKHRARRRVDAYAPTKVSNARRDGERARVVEFASTDGSDDGGSRFNSRGGNGRGDGRSWGDRNGDGDGEDEDEDAFAFEAFAFDERALTAFDAHALFAWQTSSAIALVGCVQHVIDVVAARECAEGRVAFA